MRAAILIPTFDNGRTVAGVAERAASVIGDVLVVDDGSTDATPRELERLGSRIRVIRHPTNLGKGRALRDGFEALAGEGFTHAIALDADGQHFPEDVPLFLKASTSEPEAIVVGERDMREAPGRSRFGLRCSNGALRWLAGLRIPDSQCGFRSYPLAAVRKLGLGGDRYDLELEVLLKAARSGMPIRTVPIRSTYAPDGGRVTHFRPVLDFTRIGLRVARVYFRC